jgi:hypothetical protein
LCYCPPAELPSPVATVTITNAQKAGLMKIIKVLSFAATCWIASCLNAGATPIAHLTLQSQPGDFIGQGGTYDILYQSPTDPISAQIRRTLPGGSPAELLFDVGSSSHVPNDFALLAFGTDQLGIPIQPGKYVDAQRADFAQPGHPGLDVSFQNRGSNTLTGQFTILDVSFFTDAFGNLQINTFDVSFEQHSEGATPALFGTFQYSALGPLSPVPEPATLTLTALSLIGVFRSYHRCVGSREG